MHEATSPLPSVFSSMRTSPARPAGVMLKRTTTLPLRPGFRFSSRS